MALVGYLPRVPRLLLWALLLAPPALADEDPSTPEPAAEDAEPTAEQIAIEAQQTRDAHCTTVAGNDSTASAEALSTVSNTWGRVSTALERTGVQYLLYWRGVLAQCLSQEPKAEADLGGFLLWIRGASADDQRTLASLRDDAERRLRRLRREGGGSSGPNKPLLGAGLGSLGAAAALGGIAAWQGAETESTRQAIISEGIKDFDSLVEQGGRTRSAAIGLGIGAGAAAIAAAVLLPASAATGDGSGVASRPGRTFVVVPSAGPGGVGLTVSGRW